MTALGARKTANDLGLGRHQTFHLRAGWLVKALQRLKSNPEALSGPESHHELGVGKNMLESIRFWVLATELAQPAGRSLSTRRTQLQLSPVGELLLRHDPYFEDSTSLWVIHVALASNDQLAAAWYWLFNEADASEFSDQQLVSEFATWLEKVGDGRKFAETQVRRELSCLRRTYLHEPAGPKTTVLDDQLTCPLAALGLVTRNEAGNLQIRNGTKPGMPMEVLVFALQRFAAMSQKSVYSIDDLRWDRFSPGRLLALDAPTLMDMLLQLQSHRGSGILISQTAGLRNVSMVPSDPLDSLAGYYARHAS